MSVTDRDRRHVFTKLEEAIGSEAANSLMQLLPFQSSAELATRSDVNTTTLVLRGEMAELKGDLTGQMAELRGELKGEFHRWDAVAGAANAIAVVTALIT